MPERQSEQPAEDISRLFSEALEPLELYEKNPEISRRLKEKLDNELEDDWKASLLTYKNPVELLRALHEAGVAEELDPGLRKAMFAFVNKRQNLNAREKAGRVLADRQKPASRRERILRTVDDSFKTPAEDRSSAPEAEEKGTEQLLDAYDFNETGKPCSMAMVVHLRDDGKIGFVSPHVPVAPPNTKEDLVKFWKEHFKYDQSSQYFVFFMGGKWHTINSRDETIPMPDAGLTAMWRETLKSNKKRDL